MNKIIILASCLFLTGYCHAQKDLKVSFIKPNTPTDTLPVGKTYMWLAELKNVGPDTIGTKDSVFITQSYNGIIAFDNSAYYPLKVLAPGDTTVIGMILSGAIFDVPENINICVKADMKSNGNNIDQNPADNSTCILLVVSETTGMKKAGRLNDIQLFPSPVKSVCTIRLQINPEEKAILLVRNLAGQTVHEEYITSPSGMIEKELNLGFLPQGMYFLQLKGSEITLNRRFLKQ